MDEDDVGVGRSSVDRAGGYGRAARSRFLMETMMTPLERAMHAVIDTIELNHAPHSAADPYISNPTAVARAVILAIRSPSVAMEQAWAANSPGGSTARRDWEGMIDALIAEGDEAEQISWGGSAAP